MNADRLLTHYERIADAPDAIVCLRRFILDLAVRGKLVEQDPNDEPAAELLKRIAAEKARSVKARKIKKIKKSKAKQVNMSDAPFELPKPWKWAALGDLFLYDAGIKREPKTLNQELWLLELEDVEKDSGRLLVRITASERESKSTKSEFCVGDILYGKLRPYLNKVLVADVPGYSTTEIVALRPFLPLCSTYCALALRGSDFVDYVTRLGQGTKMPRLRTEDATIAPFPLPPLAEQHRIVAKVDELMALCDQLEAARAEREATRDRLSTASLARLNVPDPDTDTFRNHAAFAFENLAPLTTRLDQIKPLRQTILNLAVRGKLVEQDPGDEPASELLKRIASERKSVPISAQKTKKRPVDSPLTEMAFPLPTGWASAQLSELVRVLNGRAYKKTELLDSGTPILRVGNLFTSNHWYYSNLELEEDKYCDEGDLIYAWSASFGPFIWHGPSVIYHYHIWKLPLFTEENLDKQFLYFFLLQKTHEIKGAGHGISMVHMTKEKMEQLAVPLPPLAEQHRIVAKVEELMPLCDRLEASLATGDDTRRHLLDALLHEALSLSEEDIEQNISTITQELPDQSPEVLTEPTPAGTSSE